MSNLMIHAERELKMAGLLDKNSDYDGMIGEAVLELMSIFSKQGHSGFSAGYALSVFSKLASFKPLTPISSDPSEWMEVGTDGRGTCFQNIRYSSCFSYDGGKTWYDIDDRKRKNWPNQSWFQKLRNLTR